MRTDTPVLPAIPEPARDDRGGPMARSPRAGSAVTTAAGLLIRTVRRHWMLTVLLAAGLALRVITQVAYRPALFYIDSYKYLVHAKGADPVGYRVLLKLVLGVGNLALVAAVQHLLGLAMAATLYALLIRRGAPRWAAALAAAPVLLDAYQLQMEQTIMPDVMFEALIVAGLAILLWNPRPRLRLIALSAMLLGTSTDVRQIGEALIAPALIFALLATRGWRRRLGYLAVTAACFFVPILAYMGASYMVGGQFALTTQGPNVVYGRAAIAANCATLSLPSYERSLCPSPSFKALGVDQIINTPSGPYRSYKPPAGMTVQQATAGFDLSVLRQQPLAIPLSVARDAVRLFALTRDGSPVITPIWRWQFQTAYPYYPPGVTYKIVASAGERYGGGGPVAVQPLAVFLRAYQLDGGYTPGPLLAVMTVAGALGSLPAFSRRRGRAVSRSGARINRASVFDRQLALATALVMLSGTAVLLGSDIYEFSWRYQLPALVTLPLAGTLGYMVIAGRLRHALAGRQHRLPAWQRRLHTARRSVRALGPGAEPGHREPVTEPAS